MRRKLTTEIVNERLENRGITLTSECVGASKKSHFMCDNGHIWSARLDHILAGGQCPYCSGWVLSKDIINSRLVSRGIAMIGDYTTTKTKTEFLCSNGHTWVVLPKDVLSGHGCPHCSDTRLSKEAVNNRLLQNGQGISIVGDYVNAHTKTELICGNGHTWHAIPGGGCPYCSKTGFKLDKPAWVYVLLFANYIKYGITNNLQNRLSTHQRVNGEYTLVGSRYFDVGLNALNLENEIKRIFGGCFVTKEVCPDGYTETLCISNLDKLLEYTEART